MKNVFSQWTSFLKKSSGLSLLNPTKRSGRTLWAIALNCALISVLMGFFLYQNAFVENTRLAGKAIAQQQAHTFLNSLDARVTHLQELTRRVAEQPALRHAIEQQDLPAQTVFIAQIKALIPDVVDIQVFTQPNLQPDMTIFPPISFSTLKLLSDAFDGKAPRPRVQQAQNKQLLTLVYPIAHTNPTVTPTPLGVLVMNIDFQALLGHMTASQTAYTQLLQGKAWTLYQSGNNQWINSPYTSTVHNAAGWNTKIFLDPDFHPFTNNALSFWLIVMLGTGLLVLLLLMMFPFIYKLLVKENPAEAPSVPVISRAAATAALSARIKSAVPPASIFRAYDIRGIFNDTLTAEDVRLIGQALGSEALSKGKNIMAVARDGRLSGDDLRAALISGITETGCAVQDVGMVPTPVLYFAAKQLASLSGVMLTGSHNPANYNGLKMVIGDQTLAGEEIQKLRGRIEKNQLTRGKTPGLVVQKNVSGDYIKRITQHISLAKPMAVVVDAGNGVAGPLIQELLTALGCQVIPLYCEIDGNFPNHHPDPSKPENLAALITEVKAQRADIGIALDGDGDRLGVVTSAGTIIYPDRLLMLFAKDVLSRSPGAEIIFDVKCTRHLPDLISQLGGRPVMSKTGHSFIKNKLLSTKAPLAGEMSGHIFFNDRWLGFDDALYSAARLLELLSNDLRSSEAIFAELPQSISTPEINIAVDDDRKFTLVEQFVQTATTGGGAITTIDGIRVDYPDGWGLVRASNTTPVLVARFEANTEERLKAIQQIFRDNLLRIDPSLEIPF